MGKETSMKVTLRSALLGHCHFQSIEDKYTSGIPDVNLCIKGTDVWLELKQIGKFPVRSNTPLKTSLNHLTNDQMNWILKRVKHGGKAFVLLRIQQPRQWFLIAGKDARELKEWTQEDLISNCSAHWDSLNVDELIEALVC